MSVIDTHRNLIVHAVALCNYTCGWYHHPHYSKQAKSRSIFVDEEPDVHVEPVEDEEEIEFSDDTVSGGGWG